MVFYCFYMVFAALPNVILILCQPSVISSVNPVHEIIVKHVLRFKRISYPLLCCNTQD